LPLYATRIVPPFLPILCHTRGAKPSVCGREFYRCRSAEGRQSQEGCHYIAWIRITFIVLHFVVGFVTLFARDRRGQFEVSNLVHFRSLTANSPDVAMIDAATSASAVCQMIGGCLLLLLQASAWHLLWWPLLGFFGIVPFGKWLILKIYRRSPSPAYRGSGRV
jgi:hypothetical protein